MPTPPDFFRLHCHSGVKIGHMMVETTPGGPHSLVGLLQRAIPGSVYGAWGAR